MPACAKCGFDPEAAVTSSFAFVIERDPPSLNARIFNSGARAFAYRKERDTWCWEFRHQRLEWRIPLAQPGGRLRRVTLTRWYHGRQKERDRDNLIGGMKAIVDALVLERLIADDSPGSVELHYLQMRAQPTGLRVQIEIIE